MTLTDSTDSFNFSNIPNVGEPLSVSIFLTKVKDMLDGEFDAELRIKGEVSSFKSYDSGHWYFAIKDNDGQLSCTMFKHANRHIIQEPQDGDMVILTGRPNIYKTRGQFQFIATDLVRAGEGKIRLEFEKTKQRLLEEGLFNDAAKQTIPKFITRLCIITSPQGAAMHDVMTVLERRMPMMKLYLAPSLVQGEKAATNIIEMVKLANGPANKEHKFDAILITRGGGSAEDLHCFNDESLARAIYDSKLPVVSAVGHEVDFSICDFVADHRSPTPSAAAEELSINSEELRQHLLGYQDRMQGMLNHRINNMFQDADEMWQRALRINLLGQRKADLLDWQRQVKYLLNSRLSQLRETLARYGSMIHANSPYAKHKVKYEELYSASITIKSAMQILIAKQQQLVEEHQYKLNSVIQLLLNKLRSDYASNYYKLGTLGTHLKTDITANKQSLINSNNRLSIALKSKLDKLSVQEKNHQAHLEAVNPLNVLERGYSLVRDVSGNLVTDANSLRSGDALKMQLARGRVSAEVKDIESDIR